MPLSSWNDDAFPYSGNDSTDTNESAQTSALPTGTIFSGLAESVLATLPDSIAILDQAGTIVAVNEAWRRFARNNGASDLANSVGVNYLAVCRAAADDEVACKVLDGLQTILGGTQMCFMLEYPCHSPTRRRWFLMRVMPLPDSRGSVVVQHTDITARKLAEEEQARLYEVAQTAEQGATARAQQLEAVFAAIQDGVVVFDQQGRIMRTNAADQALLGGPYTSIEDRTRHLEMRDAEGALLPMDQIPSLRILRGEILTSDRAVDISALSGDGRDIELSVTGAPMRDTEGHPVGAVLVYRDETERRRVERRYHAAIEQAPDATVVTDTEGRIRLVNQQTELMFGYAREELLGQPVERLIPERFYHAHQQHRAEYAAAPQTGLMGAGLELFGRRRDGSEFPVEVSLASLGGDDEPLIIASIRDVSELQRVHAARREAERVSQEYSRLLSLTDTALSHLELDDLLKDLLDRVRDVMAVDYVVIMLLDEAKQELVVRAALGLEEAVAAEVRVPMGKGFAGYIATTREPLIVDDLSTFLVFNPMLRKYLRSTVGVPLLLGDRVLGVLHVGMAELHHFNEQDVQLLQRAAERIAVAIERGRLYSDAQAALARVRVSEARFQRLAESGIIGIMVSDAERALEANDAFLEMVGYTKEDLAAGKLTRQALATPSALAISERVLREALMTGASQPFEQEYIRKDGSYVPVLVGTVLLEREPARFVSFIVDLSERKRLEEELRLQANLLNQAHDAIFVWEWGGPIIYWNRGAELIYGYTREDAIGAVSHDLLRTVHPTGRANFERQLEQAGEWMGELVHTTRDGRPVTVLSRHQVVRAPDGRLLVLESSVDITERKRLEREREEARASELAAQGVARQMDQFFHLASHDIRIPVTAVSGFVQIANTRAQELAADIEAQKDTTRSLTRLLRSIANADASVDKLVRMTRLLFDVARARAGTFEISPELCDLVEVVQNQVAELRSAVPARAIDLDLPPDGPIKVVMDVDRIGQVLTNFLANAVKYSADDQPVEVYLHRYNGRVRVAVRDHGPGLSPEEQERVWELFHRAPGVEVRSDSGGFGGSLGLGLHICKRIVELHPGGQVGIESEVGQGSMFWFDLLVADGAD